MIERRMVAPTDKHGLGYAYVGSSGIQKGVFLKLNGAFSAGDITALGAAKGRPNYAIQGAHKWVTADQHISGGHLVGPADKLEHQRESSDLTLDTIASGEGVVVYLSGEFETDVYASTLDTAPTIGSTLFIDATGKLTTTGVASAKPVAFFLGKKSSFDSNYVATSFVHYRLTAQDGV